jgi:acetyl esterase/lipase
MFCVDKAECGCLTVGGIPVKYRQWKDLPYVRNPQAPRLQVLNLYVPENRTEKAPVFFPNAVGGYMEAMPVMPEVYADGTANAAAAALARGYIVASAGARGSLTKAEDRWVGKAPAAIVDLKAAVRYLKSILPEVGGDPEKIISNGTSAGGAMSALLGVSGDAPEYVRNGIRFGSDRPAGSVPGG